MNKGIGSVDLDQGFVPDVWMHAYSSMPACLLKNSDTGATVVQLGYNIAAATVFVLFNAASLNLGKTKTIGGLCFGSFEVFVFVVVASRTKLPAGTLT